MDIERMENQKGITLVSLVVTIIILIILAGISINTLVGQNGIITKAKQAKENIEKAKLEEERQLNSLYAEVANLEIGSTDILDKEVIYSEFEKFRRIIAEAITNESVKTESSDSAETMAENIGKILEERTKDATATPEDIASEKTAYVNGEKITGTAIPTSGGSNRLVLAAHVVCSYGTIMRSVDTDTEYDDEYIDMSNTSSTNGKYYFVIKKDCTLRFKAHTTSSQKAKLIINGETIQTVVNNTFSEPFTLNTGDQFFITNTENSYGYHIFFYLYDPENVLTVFDG